MLEAPSPSIDSKGLSNLQELVAQMKKEENGRTETKSVKAIAFEYLFPNMTFNNLPLPNFAQIEALSKRISGDAVREAKLARGEPLAERIDLSNPDRMNVAHEMAGMIPIEQKLDDTVIKELIKAGLLKEGEKPAGICAKNILYHSGDGKTLGVTIGNAIGIVGADDKPQGYILITEPKKSEAPRNSTLLPKKFIATPKPVTAPVPA